MIGFKTKADMLSMTIMTYYEHNLSNVIRIQGKPLGMSTPFYSFTKHLFKF